MTRKVKTGESKPCSVEGCGGRMDRYRETIPAGDEIGVAFRPPDDVIYFWVCRKNDEHEETDPS